MGVCFVKFTRFLEFRNKLNMFFCFNMSFKTQEIYFDIQPRET
jgi:hypothetical protein